MAETFKLEREDSNAVQDEIKAMRAKAELVSTRLSHLNVHIEIARGARNLLQYEEITTSRALVKDEMDRVRGQIVDMRKVGVNGIEMENIMEDLLEQGEDMMAEDYIHKGLTFEQIR